MTFQQLLLSGYRLMWMMVMFDLPTDTKAQRKAAGQFRAAKGGQIPAKSGICPCY